MILLIDADDTLWENNIYFERVIDRFIAHLAHAHLTHAEVREVLNEVERDRAKVHGYGAASFTRNLRIVFERLAPERAASGDFAWLAELGRSIAEHPIELIEGVADTLHRLRHDRGHRLILFTKGDPAEQLSKTDRSGLRELFHDTRVVKEKDAATYERMAAELIAEAGGTSVPQAGASKQQMWMIGNSPRSDINPALAAGLNAVWIPHDATWVLEHESVVPVPGRLKTIARFPELLDHF